MLPALADRQSVMAVRLRFSWSRLRRGDVVVLRHPAWSGHTYIKRVIGLPDEVVRVEDGRVYLNGVLLEEPYLDGPSTKRDELDREWWTGPDEYFVMGDNRGDSQDSRAFGPVDRRLILGRVWLRCWPLRAWGPVAGKDRHRR
jgi:signal peptidase I